jgi:hypothetical protein
MVAMIAFVIVVFTALDGDGDGGDRLGGERDRTGREPAKDFGNSYEVRPGDTLTTISQVTGVPIERLEQLNPELDPQALVEGQKVVLRQ